MDGILALLIVLFYAVTIVLYIVFIIKIWRACTATLETRDHIKNMAFRDTARYLSEVRRGVISQEDQDEASKNF